MDGERAYLSASILNWTLSKFRAQSLEFTYRADQ